VRFAERRVTLQARAVPEQALERFELVAREFPSVVVDASGECEAGIRVAIDDWHDPRFDLWAFDRAMDRAAETNELTMVVVGAAAELPKVGLELLTRCQRLIRRRNHASATLLFDAVLERHRALHDLSLPLVLADYDHSLDVWQWVLRLDPAASLAVQIAALLHDVERLISEATRRIEQHALDYQKFKDRHAAHGAELAARLLDDAGAPATVVRDVARLIAAHERSFGDGDLALLNDADALSFFSLNSAGFADYYGPEHTRTKIAYSLDRLRPHARRHLARVRLREDICAILGELREGTS
jgi:hypothetical protein